MAAAAAAISHGTVTARSSRPEQTGAGAARARGLCRRRRLKTGDRERGQGDTSAAYECGSTTDGRTRDRRPPAYIRAWSFIGKWRHVNGRRRRDDIDIFPGTSASPLPLPRDRPTAPCRPLGADRSSCAREISRRPAGWRETWAECPPSKDHSYDADK